MTDQRDSSTEAEAKELRYLRDTPVATILANHLFVLLQVATLRLSQQPTDLEGAQLVIDTVQGMIDTGGQRLGEHVELYRSALSELQQAYVRAANDSVRADTQRQDESKPEPA